jgi:hypothetical protein
MKMQQLIRGALGAVTLLASLSVSATTISIVNADGPGEGFNDTTPVAPVGGNQGATLGAQRLNVFHHAAQIWAAQIHSNVEIKVEAKFDSLSCTSTSAVLGSAGTTTVHRDFFGAPIRATWYPQALANALSGQDLAAADPDLGATFNSAIDNNNGCLTGINWYLGLDGNAGNDIDLLDVVLHEIGHGLGFASYVNESTGQPFLNYLDIFSVHLEDHSLGLSWADMSSNQRKNSAVDSGDLHFVGPAVIEAYGHAPMYAPNPARPGSSVSHFDTSFSPNELMEPFIAYTPIHSPGLARELLFDLGWTDSGQVANSPPAVSITSPQTGSVFNEGETITFEGSASDEDGDLSEGLEWSSNVDGILGSGASLVISTLTAGDHEITASVDDSSGVSGIDTILLQVQAPGGGTDVPTPPSTVSAGDLGDGSARVIWTHADATSVTRFDVVRESPHKKRPNTWVGTTLVASVDSSVNEIVDPSGAGTFRYCVSAINVYGASEPLCDEVVVTAGDGGGDGGGGNGDFCSSHPTHRRCTN